MKTVRVGNKQFLWFPVFFENREISRDELFHQYPLSGTVPGCGLPNFEETPIMVGYFIRSLVKCSRNSGNPGCPGVSGGSVPRARPRVSATGRKRGKNPRQSARSGNTETLAD
jgi:hypothetical protein